MIKTEQNRPSADTLTDIYTTPAGKRGVMAFIHICNTEDTADNAVVTVAKSGAADALSQHVIHEKDVNPDSFLCMGLNYGLVTSDVVRVKSINGRLSFHVTIEETDA